MIGLGDINNDGCDDYAAGSPNEDAPRLSNQGGVRIVYGWGAPGCVPAQRMVRLATGGNSAGWSLAANDFDGDDIKELVIGARTRRSNNVTVGGVWVVPGTSLANLTPSLFLLRRAKIQLM